LQCQGSREGSAGTDRVDQHPIVAGTTGAVAARLGRRFILVEAGDAYDDLIVPRLTRLGARFTSVALS